MSDDEGPPPEGVPSAAPPPPIEGLFEPAFITLDKATAAKLGKRRVNVPPGEYKDGTTAMYKNGEFLGLAKGTKLTKFEKDGWIKIGKRRVGTLPGGGEVSCWYDETGKTRGRTDGFFRELKLTRVEAVLTRVPRPCRPG